MKAGHKIQYDNKFKRGKAMSRAPIMSGMRKLPKAPDSIGMMKKKIMIVPCMVTRPMYCSGSASCMKSGEWPYSSAPKIGISCHGQASCVRMSIAKRPPILKKMSVVNRNCTPIVL